MKIPTQCAICGRSNINWLTVGAELESLMLFCPDCHKRMNENNK